MSLSHHNGDPEQLRRLTADRYVPHRAVQLLPGSAQAHQEGARSLLDRTRCSSAAAWPTATATATPICRSCSPAARRWAQARPARRLQPAEDRQIQVDRPRQATTPSAAAGGRQGPADEPAADDDAENGSPHRTIRRQPGPDLRTGLASAFDFEFGERRYVCAMALCAGAGRRPAACAGGGGAGLPNRWRGQKSSLVSIPGRAISARGIGTPRGRRVGRRGPRQPHRCDAHATATRHRSTTNKIGPIRFRCCLTARSGITAPRPQSATFRWVPMCTASFISRSRRQEAVCQGPAAGGRFQPLVRAAAAVADRRIGARQADTHGHQRRSG